MQMGYGHGAKAPLRYGLWGVGSALRAFEV